MSGTLRGEQPREQTEARIDAKEIGHGHAMSRLPEECTFCHYL